VKFVEKTLQDIYESVLSEKISNIKVNRKINKLGTKTPDGKLVAFLSISNDKKNAYVIKGEGKSFKKAINHALEIYLAKKPKNFKPTNVKLDLVTKISPIFEDKDNIDLNSDKLTYNRGLDGIAFGANLETSFLPQEVTSYHIINGKKVHIKNAFRALHNHLPTTFSKFTKPIDENIPVKAFKFRTKSYFINNDGFYKLYRGHRLFTDLTEKDLLHAITLTKDNYFKNVVNKKGKFIYSYLPHLNKREKRYNILRHAGTIYSMLETYELVPDEELLKEAKRAFKFLFKKIKPLEINGKNVQVVVEKDAQKIGGNALAIVALAKYTQLTGNKEHIPLMQDLASWMKEVQGDNGEFTVHKQQYSTGDKFDFVSHYYPGEAILALVRLYQIDKNDEWLDVAEKAANFLINIRDKNATIDTIAHDHWLLYGLNELYRERQKDFYLEHSFFIAKAMMKTQISEESAKRRELIGGYVPKSGKEPKSTPVACRSEGLGAAYRLARDYGHDELANKMSFAIQQGIKFQLQMQLRPENIMYYKNKKLCLGAIQGGLKSYSLRIDFTQHNISSFISYYNILKEKR